MCVGIPTSRQWALARFGSRRVCYVFTEDLALMGALRDRYVGNPTLSRTTPPRDFPRRKLVVLALRTLRSGQTESLLG
jgi:hypothetical protein